MPKRVMNTSIKDAYNEFVEANPNANVSFTTFKRYRPQQVVSYTKAVRNSCCCIKCENTEFKFDALKKFVTCDAHNISELFRATACDTSSYLCASGSCRTCKNWKDRVRDMLREGLDRSQDCCYTIWDKSAEDKFTKRFVRVATLDELLVMFIHDFTDYRLHIFTAKRQQKFLMEKKSNLSDEEFIIIMDYSEHYAPGAQNEVQQAFYGKSQISIFTVVMYMKDRDPISFIILNDDLGQDPVQHWYYIKKLTIIAKNEKPTIKKLFTFTDGAPTQFKNFKHISNVLYASQDFGVELTENFFATCHGKTSADEIGGNVKNLTDRLLTNNKNLNINNAKEMFDLIKNKTKTRLILVDKEEYDGYRAMLQKRWTRVNSIKGTRSFHLFGKVDKKNVRACATAYSDGEKIFKMIK